jgi:phenylpyruvate tautomerase PptA (4-oxalocrotonate tautomerase family)
MPIIDIEFVQERPGPIETTLARKFADALGDVFEAKPGKIWVRLRELSYGAYAENGVAKPPKPVFVTVLASSPPEGKEIEARLAAIAEVVAKLCKRPLENVHVHFEPAAKGRIAFGGKISK